jgi:hypothetical protein
MTNNLTRYKKDLDALLSDGTLLWIAMRREIWPKETTEYLEKNWGDEAEKVTKILPSFRDKYQAWYSESKALIRQLLPDRLDDFVSHYERPKSRKELTNESYRISDYLVGLNVTRASDNAEVVGLKAAIPHFQQQLGIVEAIKARFESSLFDIRQLMQADLFDSEVDAASELAKHKFARAAGALAGVVLERHLAQVSDNHKIKIAKKNPTIATFNDALKEANVIDMPQWRFVQHLADIRNLCDHGKTSDPTAEQVGDLIAGVKKVTKTVF